MRVLVVSPHLDDAVLSCGRLLAAHPGSYVATVFAGEPQFSALTQTEYDRACGFPNAREALKTRRDEEARAAGVLRFTSLALPFLDQQYRTSEGLGLDMYEVAAAIANLLHLAATFYEVDLVALPTGILHPDHRATAEACQRLNLARFRELMRVVIYDELPYRVQDPVATSDARARWGSGARVFLDQGPVGWKQAGMLAYRSQMGGLDWHELNCAEVYWELL